MARATILVFAITLTASLGFVIEPKVDASLDWRIVGGNDATTGQFPWQISMRRAATGAHICGGSIINSKWILTAAHCVFYSTPSTLYIVVGSLTLSSGGHIHQVSRIITHADYSTGPIVNDVAVLELEEEIEFSNDVQPIQLESEIIEEVDCLVSGWGRLETDGAVPDTLQYIPLKTISLSECQVYWPNSVQSGAICTLTQQGEGVCNGDSGSALTADRKQIGIVSWGNACANGIPDVYTRISSYVDWIENAINNINN